MEFYEVLIQTEKANKPILTGLTIHEEAYKAARALKTNFGLGPETLIRQAFEDKNYRTNLDSPLVKALTRKRVKKLLGAHKQIQLRLPPRDKKQLKEFSETSKKSMGFLVECLVMETWEGVQNLNTKKQNQLDETLNIMGKFESTIKEITLSLAEIWENPNHPTVTNFETNMKTAFDGVLETLK